MQVQKIAFDLPDPIYPEEARAMVAKLLDGKQPGLVATLMNYHRQTGDSVEGFPRVQFARHHKGFGLLGFGEAGQQVVTDAAPIIHDALCRKYDVVIPVSQTTYSQSAEWRPYRLEYSIPRMVVQKKHNHTAQLKAPDTGKPFLESLFQQSLARQATVLGMELPNNIEVEFLGAERTFTAKRSNSGGGNLAAMGLINAKFGVNLKLSGIWSFGYLLSKGYGHLDANLACSGAMNTVEEVSHALPK